MRTYRKVQNFRDQEALDVSSRLISAGQRQRTAGTTTFLSTLMTLSSPGPPSLSFPPHTSSPCTEKKTSRRRMCDTLMGVSTLVVSGCHPSLTRSSPLERSRTTLVIVRQSPLSIQSKLRLVLSVRITTSPYCAALLSWPLLHWQFRPA